MDWTPQETEKLLQAVSAKQFLESTLQLKQDNLSYASLGRLCGFKSRSYFRDIIKGPKKLNLNLVSKLSSVLNLNPEAADYFSNLCALDFAECRLGGYSELKVRQQLESVRSKLTSSNYSLGFQDYNIPIVFAALSSSKRGSHLGSLEKRTELSVDLIKITLAKMEELGLVAKKGALYYPVVTHAVSSQLSSKSYFKGYYLNSLDKAYHSSKRTFNDPARLYFASHFLVKKELLPQLKAELRKTPIKFIEQSDITEGDKVAHLVCALL